jgi:RES domain-containing protein
VASEPLSLFYEAPGRLVAFRWSTYDVPFWARPNSRAGRWNTAGGPSTQYWSLTPEAAWAELIRHEGLTTEEELELVRMPIWVCQVPTARILDLRRADERERWKIAEEDLIADDWTRCQELGGEIRNLVPGVIAPCAALPQNANLILFGSKRAIAWDRTPALASVIPATTVAIGRPPSGLVGMVHRPPPIPRTDRLF